MHFPVFYRNTYGVFVVLCEMTNEGQSKMARRTLGLAFGCLIPLLLLRNRFSFGIVSNQFSKTIHYSFIHYY